MDFFVSTKFPILLWSFNSVPGRILANGPILQLTPIDASSIIVFGKITVPCFIMQFFKIQFAPIFLHSSQY